MTDASTKIQEQLTQLLANERAATKALVDSAVTDAAKAQIAAQLDPLRAEIKALQEMGERVERAKLPGLEYAKNGEAEKFSLWRACQLATELKLGNYRAWEDKAFGLEVEAMNEIRRRDLAPDQRRAAFNVGATSTGGVFVPNTVMMDSIIPDLRAMSVLERAGVQTMSGLVGNFDWVVDQGGITAYEIDTESEGTATESGDTYKLVSVSPHTVSANTSMTRGMRKQSAVSMEARIRQKFARELSLMQDLHGLCGTGVGKIPMGVHGTTNIGTHSWSGLDYGPSITVSSTGQNIDLALRTMAYAPLIANYRTAGGRWGWIAQPQVSLKIASVQDKESRPVFANYGNATLNSLMGSPLYDTTNVTAATFTSSNRYLVYGDWTQMTLCRWGDLEIIAGYAGDDMKADVMTLAAFMEHDILVEQPKAFVKATSLTAA